MRGEGDDEDFCGGDFGREGEDVSGGRVGAGPVDVLDQGVEDAADAERGFDHIWSVFPDWVHVSWELEVGFIGERYRFATFGSF